jgi:hypothetical protein
VKVKFHGRIERQFIAGREKQHSIVRRFLGIASPSFLILVRVEWTWRLQNG